MPAPEFFKNINFENKFFGNFGNLKEILVMKILNESLKIK